MAAPIYIAMMRHYSLCGCWITAVRRGARYKLIRTSWLDNADRVQDILYVAFNVLKFSNHVKEVGAGKPTYRDVVDFILRTFNVGVIAATSNEGRHYITAFSVLKFLYLQHKIHNSREFTKHQLK